MIVGSASLISRMQQMFASAGKLLPQFLSDVGHERMQQTQRLLQALSTSRVRAALLCGLASSGGHVCLC